MERGGRDAGVHTDGNGHGVRLADAVRVWIRVALYSFGGPAGQIAVMHRILVEEKRWISEDRFLHALNYCMLLPGPEAQQLATYIGWLFHRTKGGLIAGGLFVLPGFLSILLLSITYALYRQTAIVEALFFGLKAAVLAVVIQAVLKLGERALKNRVMLAIAATAFIAIFVFDVPFPFIVVTAGIVGYLGGTFAPDTFEVMKGHTTTGRDEGEYLITDEAADEVRPSTRRALVTVVTWGGLWLVPLGILALVLGGTSVFTQIGTFFSTAAVVTFGGAYAVLAYIAQQAVDTYGWLQPGEMLDGLGMAETTPGPLIQVVQFVGFMGAYRFSEAIHPITAGILASVLTTWVTFVPCFLWIFLGAPYIEYLRGNRRLTTALSGITASVVGVILYLAVWFSLHVVFGQVHEVHWYAIRIQVPDATTVDAASLALTVAALIALLRFRSGMLATLAASSALGLVYHLLARG